MPAVTATQLEPFHLVSVPVLTASIRKLRLSPSTSASSAAVGGGGPPSASYESVTCVMRDAARVLYKRVVVKDNKLVGAVLYGDTADGNWYFDLLKKGEDISDIREALIREMREETGLEVAPVRFLGVVERADPDTATRWLITAFEAEPTSSSDEEAP